jgi:hypothetical protein
VKRSIALLLPLVLAGCPDDDPGPKNPRQVWLALMGSETMVQLIPYEPDPF